MISTGDIDLSFSGCSAVASARGSGSRDRRFESSQPEDIFIFICRFSVNHAEV